MARGGQGKGKGLSGQALKDYRHKLSILKKKGLASKRIDARSHRPTKYMRAKIRKNEDVLEGRAVSLKAPKSVREEYKAAGVFDVRGSRLIVPKEHAEQRTKIVKGGFVHVEAPVPTPPNRPPSKYTQGRMILPVNVKSLSGVLDYLKRHGERIDAELTGSDQFAFKIFGHQSLDFFPGVVDSNGMVEYIEKRYQHILKNTKSDHEAYKGDGSYDDFEIVRFNSPLGPVFKEGKKAYSAPGEGRRPIVNRVDATGRNSNRRKSTSIKVRRREADEKALAEWTQNQKDRKARNQAVYRARMAEDKRKQANATQAERTRRNRRGEYTRPKKGK